MTLHVLGSNISMIPSLETCAYHWDNIFKNNIGFGVLYNVVMGTCTIVSVLLFCKIIQALSTQYESSSLKAYHENVLKSEKIVDTLTNQTETLIQAKKNSVSVTDYECIRRDDNSAEGLLSNDIEEHAEDEARKVAPNDALNAGEYICDGAEENVGDIKPKDKLYGFGPHCEQAFKYEKDEEILVNTIEALINFKENEVCDAYYECIPVGANSAEAVPMNDTEEYAEE